MKLPRAGLRRRVILAFSVIALFMSEPALAQTVPGVRVAASSPAGISAPELNPAARAPRPAARDADIFAPEPPGPYPLANSAVEVTLASVSFRGATALKAEDFGPAYRKFIGKPRKVGARFKGTNADLMIGKTFTDDAVKARPDLANFKVLYFATHGLLPQPSACLPQAAARPGSSDA